MPAGCFVILLPLASDYKVLGYYFKEGKSNFKITSELFLRLNLNHSKDDYNLLKMQDFNLLSYIYKFKGKLSRKASGVIFGILLNENDKPEKYRASLKGAAEAIEIITTDLLKLKNEEFEPLLKDIYLEHLEPLIDILKPAALKESIINITKLMLSGGKSERKIAQDLLKKVEDKEHEKISEYYNIAESALKLEDFEKASKSYKKAAEIAESLYLMDVAESLNEKATFSGTIPEISKERDKIVQDARNFLRNEDFHNAYINYKKASELSKKLVEFDKEEEYRLKSEALKSFYEVDQKFSKK
ncbi:MAG: hypothetical protein ACFFC1_22910 [Promethearchaeota archaeon]